MPQIVGKEAPSITIEYYKGNPFSYTFTVSGAIPASNVIARIYRVGDPDKQVIIQFTVDEGLVISGQDIELSKTAQEMIMPPGTYEFAMEGSISGTFAAFVQRSFVLVRDAVGQQLPAPGFIIATAVASDEINIAWGASTAATSYTLQRSLDALAWSTVYTGPNAIFENTGLTPETLYYYRVWATATGYSDSAIIITNATTLAVGGSGGGGGPVSGCYVPVGGNTADYLVKASDADHDVEWVAFEEVPHDHDDRYYTKDEVDALANGGVFTGTI